LLGAVSRSRRRVLCLDRLWFRRTIGEDAEQHQAEANGDNGRANASDDQIAALLIRRFWRFGSVLHVRSE
jgi:hypothetical protein